MTNKIGDTAQYVRNELDAKTESEVYYSVTLHVFIV